MTIRFKKIISTFICALMITVSIMGNYNEVKAEAFTATALTATQVVILAGALVAAGLAVSNNQDAIAAAYDYWVNANVEVKQSLKLAFDNFSNGVVSISQDVYSNMVSWVDSISDTVSRVIDNLIFWDDNLVGVGAGNYITSNSITIEDYYITLNLHEVDAGTVDSYDIYHVYINGVRAIKNQQYMLSNGESITFYDDIAYSSPTGYIPQLFIYSSGYWTYIKVKDADSEEYITSKIHDVRDVEDVAYDYTTTNVINEDWYHDLVLEDTIQVNVPSELDGVVGVTAEQVLVNTGTDTNTDTQTDAYNLDELMDAWSINSIDVQGLYDAILERFNYNIFSDTLKKLEQLRNAPKVAPKFAINLNSLLEIAKNFGQFNNTLPDEDTTFLDFAKLEEWEFEGVTLIEYFRMLISMGMVITTFFHVKNKVLPQKAMKG